MVIKLNSHVFLHTQTQKIIKRYKIKMGKNAHAHTVHSTIVKELLWSESKFKVSQSYVHLKFTKFGMELCWNRYEKPKTELHTHWRQRYVLLSQETVQHWYCIWLWSNEHFTIVPCLSKCAACRTIAFKCSWDCKCNAKQMHNIQTHTHRETKAHTQCE